MCARLSYKLSNACWQPHLLPAKKLHGRSRTGTCFQQAAPSVAGTSGADPISQKCRELAESRELVEGKEVLELGSGCGLCAILAAKLGAKQASSSHMIRQECFTGGWVAQRSLSWHGYHDGSYASGAPRTQKIGQQSNWRGELQAGSRSDDHSQGDGRGGTIAYPFWGSA